MSSRQLNPPPLPSPPPASTLTNPSLSISQNNGSDLIRPPPTTKMSKTPHLPSEIWLIILDFLPPSFFQQDIRRLALSKRWYSLAFPSFYPRIEYTPRVISRLVNRKTKSLDKSRALLKKSLRSVNIVLSGIPPTPSNPDDPNIVFNTTGNLPRFCSMLVEFQELRSLRFVANHPNQEWRGDPYQMDYLPLRSIEPYLSSLLAANTLTSMDIDLCGTAIVDGHVSVHFCGFVSPLLGKLTKLTLRLRSICREALRPTGEKVPLKELSVKLYLGRVSEVNPKLNCARLCNDRGWRAWSDPVDEVRTAMLKLVDKMESPSKVEMVHLNPRLGEVHRWDALGGDEGKCVRDESEGKMGEFTDLWAGKEIQWGGEGGGCFKEENWEREGEEMRYAEDSDSDLVDTDDGL